MLLKIGDEVLYRSSRDAASSAAIVTAIHGEDVGDIRKMPAVNLRLEIEGKTVEKSSVAHEFQVTDADKERWQY